MKEFDVNEFKKEYIYSNMLNPYMYEDFKKVNPKLTKKMYDFLRGNKTEWKILCGVEVEMRYENEIMRGNWMLGIVNEHIYKHRYIPSYYLNKENWRAI